ncbi:hypothetical protein [Parasitella parasitica]|uniref:Uncharacterized protein n=1 Tax=Parasitella parasitica TaxID=35722 RepID=A0A0B7NMG7_9FUNG|nr:hypothetical protein [Parasitella parasitica]
MSSTTSYTTIYGSLLKKECLTEMTFSYFMGLNNSDDAVDLFSDVKKVTVIIEAAAPGPALTTEQELFEKYVSVIFPGPLTKRKWSREQVRELFKMHFVDELKASHAAGLSEINSSTALGYIRQAKNGLQPEEDASSGTPLRERPKDALAQELQGVRLNGRTIFVGAVTFLKCALTPRIHEVDELQGVRLNGRTIFVGAVTFLFFKRHQFGWPESAPLSGVFVSLLAALSEAGEVVQAAVLTPSAIKRFSERAKRSQIANQESDLKKQEQVAAQAKTKKDEIAKEIVALKKQQITVDHEKSILAGIRKKLLEDEKLLKEERKKFLEEKKKFLEEKKKFLEEKQQFEKLQENAK